MLLGQGYRWKSSLCPRPSKPHFPPGNLLEDQYLDLIHYLRVAFVQRGNASDNSLTFERERPVCVDERLHLWQSLQH